MDDYDDQAWFWTDEWQAGEREVDEHIRKGEVLTFNTIEEFLLSLSQADNQVERS